MFDRIRALFTRKPTTESEPNAPAEAATVLAMGTQSGISAVPGAALGTADNEPPEEKPNPESEGAV